MMRPQASLWSNLRRRVGPKSSPSSRRRWLFFPAGLERLESITLLSNFVVNSTADSGFGSLRSAIISSNAATGQINTIHFNIAGSGVQIIAPLSALPKVTNPVVIDATTITGYTNSPLIELEGVSAGAGATGLVIAASATGTVVKGLDVNTFGGDGIDVLANNVVLSANYIGTGPFGGGAAPNRGSGVVVRGANDTVGGVNLFNPDGTFHVMAGNLISGNFGNGVVLAGSGNLVEGNWIGVNVTGNVAVGNALDGVVVDGVSSNTIGGTTAGTRNVISGNLGQGVSIANIAAPPPTTYSTSAGPLTLTQAGIKAGFSLSNFATNFPTVGGNGILGPVGTTFPFSGGVLVTSFTGNIYKFPTDTDGQVATAVPKIPYPTGSGGLAQVNGHIYMTTGSPAGVSEVDNSGKLIQFIAAVHNAIGIVSDKVSGPMYGHLLVSTGTSNAPSIYDVDPVAKTAKLITLLPGSGDGVVLDPLANILYVAINGYGVVGYNLTTKQKVWDSGQFTSAQGAADGATIGAGDLRNELFVNTNQGTIVEIPLNSPSTHTIIASGGTRGDLATVDPNNGTFLLTQSDRVVRLFPPLGSSFGGGPITTTTGNVVEGNLIGVGSDGTTTVANGSNGVMVSAGAAGNTIGGSSAGQGNLIAGNNGNGVALFDPSTSTNSVVGNSIGTDAFGGLNAGNLGDGVWISGGGSSNSVVGNTIAHNNQDGVGVDAASAGNAVQKNRIFGNLGQGINLGNGSNPVQSYPTLSAAYGSGAATYVTGTATGPSGSLLTIDFYANTAKDPSGYGQGEFYLGSTTVTPGSNFQAPLPLGAYPGMWVSATATSASQGTSGFSADIVVQKATTSATLAGSGSPTTYGQQVVFTAIYSSVPAVTGTVVFQVDGVTIGNPAPIDPAGTATTPSITSIGAGVHTVTAIYSGDSLHDGVTSTMTQTVNQAHLTVTADSKTKITGAPNPALTYTLSGFVNAESAGAVTGTPDLSTTATASSPSGTYPITVAPGTLSAKNYDFSNLVNGVLTVGHHALADFDAVGQTEMAIFRPSTAQWFALNPVTGKAHQIVNPNNATGAFGATGLSDIPVPGDYDGIGQTEMAIFRPSTAQWFVLNPLTGKAHQIVNPNNATGAFGATGLFDIPVPGDYDGIGRTEMAIFRPSTAQWFVLNPLTGKAHQIVNPNNAAGAFGATGLSDIPVPGDYDGIGQTEMAIFRPSTAQWFVFNPVTGKAHQIVNPNNSAGAFGATYLFDLPVATSIASLVKLGRVGFG